MNSKNDIIDAAQIIRADIDLSYRNGYAFSRGLRATLGFLGFLGLLAILSGDSGLIIGPIILVIAIYILTSTYGTEITLEKNYIRNYTTSFGIKKGKWLPSLNYPDITILKTGKGVQMNQVFGPGKVELKEDVYEIHLLSANHRKRILIKEVKNLKDAFILAEELANKMDKNLVQFNPKISQATLNRRYERH